MFEHPKEPSICWTEWWEELMIHWSREVSRQLQIYFVLFFVSVQFCSLTWCLETLCVTLYMFCTRSIYLKMLHHCLYPCLKHTQLYTSVSCTRFSLTSAYYGVYKCVFKCVPVLSSVNCKRSTLLICTFDRSNFIIWAGAGFTTMPWLLSTKHQRTIHTSVFARNFFVQVSDIENPV